MNPIFADLPTTVFEVMSQLARETGAVNLGQGFPDDPGPEDVRRKAADAVVEGWNQYPPMMGLPELRAAIAAHYGHWQGLTLDPEREVMVTSGATEALAGALLALVSPGDEVVLFEPMYDAYLPLVRRAGGVPRFVTLEPPRFRLTEAALARAFSRKTKVVLFNNPLNPAATVFGPEDLALLADFCIRFDAVALCDEVWEHVVFDGRRHQPLMALPGMRERTIKVGSAGKIFNLTGWKVGLVGAAPHLMKGLAKAHQFLTFTTPPNLQAAVAYGLMKEDSYFEDLRTRPAAQPRPLRRRPAGSRVRRAAERGHVFPQHRHRRARRGGRCGLLPAAGDGARGRRHSGQRLLCRGRRQECGALLLRQARRDPRCRPGAARGRRAASGVIGWLSP